MVTTVAQEWDNLPKDLRESDEYLHLIADAIPALVAYVDKNHTYRFVNQSFEDWFGKSTDQIIGRHLSALVGPHAYEVIREYSNIALSGERTTYEMWMPYADGKRYVSASYVPDIQLDGSVPGFFVLVSDLTARKEAEVEVQREKEYTQAILDSLQSEVCIIDAEGFIVGANEPWDRFWANNDGSSDTKGWEGVNYFDACQPQKMPGEDDASPTEVVTGIKDVLAGKADRYIAEYPCHSPTEKRWFRVTATPLARMNELPSKRAVIRHMLITDQRMASDALRDANAELAKSVSGLFKAQKTLRRELDLKNRFFSILAHDLRNPFSTLLGASAALEKKAGVMARDTMETYARNIHSSAGKMYELLEQLLEWGRYQTGDIPLQPARLDIGDIVAGCVSVTAMQAEQKGVSVRQELSAQSCFADINVLRTVLRNLLNNAVKYSEPEGAIVIQSVQSGDSVTFSVSDQGAGIVPELKDDVFDLDCKTSTPGTAGEKGSGLGLPVCHDLIGRSGGRIWVESTPGEGAAFHFTLPASEETPA